MAGKGLYANIHAKRKRGGKMRKKGAKGAPKASDFKTENPKRQITDDQIKKVKKYKKEEMMIKERKAFLREKKRKGGRIGFKKGTGRTGVPAMDIKTKISLAKKKKNKGNLGMQSVIHGLDKNPNVTAADPKAKFIAANKKNKKKVI